VPDRTDFALDREWLLVLKELSVEPDDLLRRAQLPADLFSREGVRLNSEEYFRLWRCLDDQTEDAQLPLQIADVLSVDMFHPVLFAAFCSSNLRTAVNRVAEYKKLVAPIKIDMADTPEGFYVGLVWTDQSVEVPYSMALTELVYATQLARLATRERIVPVRVECAAAVEPRGAYEEYFGVAPQLGDRHGIIFSQADAERPFLSASESLWQVFEPELQRRMSKLDASAPLHQRVKSALLENLPSGEASIATIAKRLALSPRTLQRRLASEGTSFRDIVNQTRKGLALHYVETTSLSYAEVAFLIGFEEVSSFFHAFREWTGSTPEQVRNLSRHDPEE